VVLADLIMVAAAVAVVSSLRHHNLFLPQLTQFKLVLVVEH
tara:strand:- start:529 stop:651 length:123 start_codon:yes stop_codon:yes gene_type:complete